PRRHLRMEEETDGEAVLGGPGGVRPDPIGAGLEVSWTAGVRVGEVPCPLAVHAHGDVDPVDHCNLPFERGVSQLVERRRSVLEKRGSRRSLRESPSRFAPSTTIMMARPGMVATHHAVSR